MRDLRAVLLLIVLFCLQEFFAEEPITLISRLSIKPERADEFLNWIHVDLELSRNFAGNLQFDVYQNSQSATEIVFIERWDSVSSQERYLSWRAQRGDFEVMREYLAGPPDMTQYQAQNE